MERFSPAKSLGSVSVKADFSRQQTPGLPAQEVADDQTETDARESRGRIYSLITDSGVVFVARAICSQKSERITRASVPRADQSSETGRPVEIKHDPAPVH